MHHLILMDDAPKPLQHLPSSKLNWYAISGPAFGGVLKLQLRERKKES